MTGLAHALTGTVIALKVKNPRLAAPLAFFSHFVLDILPHFGKVPFYTVGNPVFPFVVAADGLLSAYAIYYISSKAPKAARRRVVLCALLAIVPDFTLGIKYALHNPNFWLFNFHERIQWYENPPGLITEITVVTVLVIMARKLLLDRKAALSPQAAAMPTELID